MAVDWPTTLPLNPARYSEQKQPSSVHTQPDSGPTKSRRRFTKSVTKATAEYVLTNAQAVILDDFWADDMASGAIKLNFRHPWRDTMVEVRIKEAPKFSDNGPLTVMASFELEYL
jgi:hypothetical protein